MGFSDVRVPDRLDVRRLEGAATGAQVRPIRWICLRSNGPAAAAPAQDWSGGFEEFGLGARVWGAVPQGFDIYYHDIAIDNKRVGPLK